MTKGEPIRAISPDSANTVRYAIYGSPIGGKGGNNGSGRNAGGWDSPKVAGSGTIPALLLARAGVPACASRRFRYVTYQYAVYFICPYYSSPIMIRSRRSSICVDSIW